MAIHIIGFLVAILCYLPICGVLLLQRAFRKLMSRKTPKNGNMGV